MSITTWCLARRRRAKEKEIRKLFQDHLDDKYNVVLWNELNDLWIFKHRAVGDRARQIAKEMGIELKDPC